ncbi:Uncharacterized membrane protein YczE [Amphibacillus marinus]|uniref:Uncharacterized membrane protein YczE n=1 Tax=Amphibacillus marinus TaxID=872970 RepID=A0A1H8LCI8_9BACI|nr:hypothetical protein [Amphibacillus marinus]SEO02526.1 Uncharacterized membrane protein YczE [Amphibacillus marinus]
MNLKHVYLSLLFYLVSAFGISLTIKAGIGVSSFNSLNVTLSEFSQIRVGTITTMINLIFLLMSFLIDKQPKLMSYALMILSLLLFGYTINLITYSIIGYFEIRQYVIKIIVFIIGVIIAGFGTGKVLNYYVFNFPIEKFCLLLAQRTTRSFKFYRYAIDLICIAAAMSLALFFNLTITVREGTIISFILLSAVISWAKE